MGCQVARLARLIPDCRPDRVGSLWHIAVNQHGLAVDLVEKTGGPTLIERFTPPDAMIERAFKSKWPNCPSEAKANGFPKIVLRGEVWEFESTCKPCEAEKEAAEALQKQPRFPLHQIW